MSARTARCFAAPICCTVLHFFVTLLYIRPFPRSFCLLMCSNKKYSDCTLNTISTYAKWSMVPTCSSVLDRICGIKKLAATLIDLPSVLPRSSRSDEPTSSDSEEDAPGLNPLAAAPSVWSAYCQVFSPISLLYTPTIFSWLPWRRSWGRRSVRFPHRLWLLVFCPAFCSSLPYYITQFDNTLILLHIHFIIPSLDTT